VLISIILSCSWSRLTISFSRLPFVAGAIAQPHGVQSLQPFVLALLVVITLLWLLLPRSSRHDHEG